MEKFEILGSEEELVKSMEADTASLPVVETDSTPEPFAAQTIDDSEQQGADGFNQQPPSETFDSGSEQSFSNEDIEGAVVTYLSERLGRQFSSIDELMNVESSPIDERIAAIAKFVQDTGRAPEDWFRYQALNPSEMDDMTAIRIQMASEYPNLAYDEIELLLNSKYKLDPDMYDEGDVKLSMLQLKIDAQKAKQSIESLRSQYAAPDQAAQQYESFIDDNWVRNMYTEVDALEGVEFDLGNGNTFTFGINDQYKSQLKQKNERLENFFDSYVRNDGSWDYDLLSSHMTVLDNIDSIVKSAYQKGIGDGQKNLVNKAANVSVNTPQQNNNNQADPIVDQLKNIMGFGNTLTFKV